MLTFHCFYLLGATLQGVFGEGEGDGPEKLMSSISSAATAAKAMEAGLHVGTHTSPTRTDMQY
jgi:hypothetical protein